MDLVGEGPTSPLVRWQEGVPTVGPVGMDGAEVLEPPSEALHGVADGGGLGKRGRIADAVDGVCAKV